MMSLGGFDHHFQQQQQQQNYPIQGYSRPPPLRTAGTYDDDEFFNSVALNLLSRYEGLNLSIKEALDCTLVSHSSRISFREALSSRMARSAHLSSSTTLSLVQRTHELFANELKRMIDAERDCANKSPPTAPRHFTRPQTFDEDKTTKKKKGRRFFPDSCEGFFRSRKVVNLDWSLTQTIQQVQSLQLDDGTDSFLDRSKLSSYQPPPLEGYQNPK